MRHRVRTILLGALVIGFTAPANGQTIYQWTDENGVVHFGQAPPSGISDTEVRAIPGGPAVPEVSEGAVPSEETLTGEEPAAEGQEPATTPPAAGNGEAAPLPVQPTRSARGGARVQIEGQEIRQLGPSSREISGTVKNAGGRVAEDIVIVMRVIDPMQNGECLQEQIDVDPPTLGPGETGTFLLELEDPCFYGGPTIDLRADWYDPGF